MPAALDTVARLLERHPPIRAVNFHNTPANRAAELDALLARIARSFTSVSRDRLDAFASDGCWRGRPGVVLAFYNGYRNNFDIAKPLLEKHGLTGWFFVVTGFTASPVAHQAHFAATHGIGLVPDEYRDARCALSPDEIRRIARRHEVASHTRNHVTIDDAESLADETIGAQDDLKNVLGRAVHGFAWAGGAPLGERSIADHLVKAGGYRWVFSNFRIQHVAGTDG